ncbi:unnamed protein product [Staurois parvus]|uniref:Uncharacterized protein n=1 Tax=Staurois parvus TaxID=386267 RepID=A0ABN9CN72_9NEOB|nr:unnamed protein product [Staurois parvus]
MHSPQKAKTSLTIHTKLSMYKMPRFSLSFQEIRGGRLIKGRNREGSNGVFTQCRGLTP